MNSLRVATFNLWNKTGPWQDRLELIKAQLAILDADILGVQEVLELVSPGGVQNQLEEFCGDRHWVYGLGHNMSRGWLGSEHKLGFGNGIVSRFPILKHEVLPLPGGEISDQERSLLYAVVDAPFGPVNVFVTHLNWKLDEGLVREEQVRFIADAIHQRSQEGSFPSLLMGDMNAVPGSDEMRFLRGHCRLQTDHGPVHCSPHFIDVWDYFPDDGPGFTFDGRQNPYAALSHEPPRRLDYIFLQGLEPGGPGKPISASVTLAEPNAEGIYPSDHFCVMVDLQLTD